MNWANMDLNGRVAFCMVGVFAAVIVVTMLS
jgi:hypothetical protein